MKPYPKTLRIRVTKADIKHGVKEKCQKCPIARAVMKKLGIVKPLVNVGSEILIFKTMAASKRRAEGDFSKCDVPEATYLLPVEADEFISEFDAGGEVKPFSFTALQETT